MDSLKKEKILSKINWQKVNDLIPAIVQDKDTLQVLMLGYMNHEALKLSFDTKKVTFFSRSKNRIWQKGETSKNYLYISDIKLDCDNDTLLILVNPAGNTCHLEKYSCFGEEKITHLNFIKSLQSVIKDRIQTGNIDSYVFSLYKKGLNKVAQKVGEEGVEVVISALNESKGDFKNEVADLVFHLLILLEFKEVTLEDIVEVLEKRVK